MSAATFEGKRKPLPSTSRVGVTLRSSVGSLRGLLLGLHSVENSPRGINEPGSVATLPEIRIGALERLTGVTG
jgi:hypothetical protein